MSRKSINPIFIFSLPRSGSTLLQRVLGAHKEVETVAEPWVLLPFLYSSKKEGLFAEYSHGNAAVAIGDFIASLPNGEKDYHEAVALAAELLYRKAAGSFDAKYFLDKTPRYALICDEVINVFPRAKFIFLWRNPLAVIASLIETWGYGRWNLYHYKVDLFKGQMHLVEAYKHHADKVLAIKYEDFVVCPEKELDRIGAYLGVKFSSSGVLESFASVSFEGKMGDPIGSKLYRQVSDAPLEKWKETICNPWRKWWCRRYLEWLGEDRLATMGYQYNDLLKELNAIPVGARKMGSDVIRALYGITHVFFSLTILRSKFRNLIRGKYIVNHS